MKKLVLLLLLIASNIWATDIENKFLNGNDLYQKGRYQDAILQYESVPKMQIESAELYFNLGNCYYKLHKVAPSIFNYEKALRLDPNDVEIQTNLEFAQKMAIDDIKVIPKVGFRKIVSDFTSSYHYNTWGWIVVFQSFAFLIFFIGYYFSNTTKLKRLFFMTLTMLLLGIIISLFSAYFEQNRMESEKPAIVFSELVIVKTEPKKTSQDAFTLHEGTKVYILESVANWKKIQLTDDTTGWIEDSAIREIK